jgi:hypothetical protein
MLAFLAEAQEIETEDGIGALSRALEGLKG